MFKVKNSAQRWVTGLVGISTIILLISCFSLQCGADSGPSEPGSATMPAAGNLLANAGFENGLEGWLASPKLALEEKDVHTGRGALKAAGVTNQSIQLVRLCEVMMDQEDLGTIEVSYWGKRISYDPEARASLHVVVHFKSGDYINWYGPFEIDATDAGEWVFRRGEFHPRSAVAKLTVSVMLSRNAEMLLDDLYVGAPRRDVTEAEVQERKRTIPFAVTPKGKPYADFPARLKLLDIQSDADVIHFDGSGAFPLALKIVYDVINPAPVTIDSAWGSQVWMAFNFDTKAVMPFHLNGAMPLDTAGRHEWSGAFRDSYSGDSKNLFYNPEQKGSYLLLTGEGITKSFNVNVDGKCIGQFKLEEMARYYASERPAVFLAANLASYQIAFARAGSEWKKDGSVWIGLDLRDADGQEFQIHRAQVKARVGAVEIQLEPLYDATGMPLGVFAGRMNTGGEEEKIDFSATVVLKTPEGIRTNELVTVLEKGFGATTLPARHIQPVFTGARNADYFNSYNFSANATNGPADIRANIRRLAEHNFTITTFECLLRGKAYYASGILSNVCADWDPLKTAVEAAHENNIKVAACISLFLRFDDTHAEWAAVDFHGKPVASWYDAYNPEVQKYYLDIIREILMGYDVDIIYLDYIRPGPGGYTEYCRKEFMEKYGKDQREVGPYDPDFIQWRKDGITEYLKEVRKTVQAIKPNVKLMTYVWVMYNTEESRAMQDVPRWSKEAIPDLIQMGNYNKNPYFFRAGCHALAAIRSENGAKLIPMMGVYYVVANTASFQEGEEAILREMMIVGDEGFNDIAFFSVHPLMPHLDAVSRNYFPNAGKNHGLTRMDTD
ncbi:MAG: glycoside hydrolase family 10 protein [Kiritimatiellia bacterium]|jgi:uncharacterized lipoprotein YddW (UPF0748 family)